MKNLKILISLLLVLCLQIIISATTEFAIAQDRQDLPEIIRPGMSPEIIKEETVLKGAIGIHRSTENEDVKAWVSFLDKVLVRLKEATGIKIDFNFLQYTEVGSNKIFEPIISKDKEKIEKDIFDYLKEKFEKQEFDFFIADADEYIKIKDKEIPAEPFGTLEVDGNVTFAHCLYVRKSDNIKDLEHLKGKTLGGDGFRFLRKVIDAKGYDLPLDKFFSDVKQHPQGNEFYYSALLAGKEIDAFWGLSLPMMLVPYLMESKISSEITPLICDDNTEPMWIMLTRKNLDANVVNNLKDFLLKAHEDKLLLQNWGFYIRLLKLRLTPINEQWDKSFKNYEEFLHKAQESKWTEEKFWKM